MALMMDDERAKQMFDMVRDNNRMLRSMRRSAFIGGILKVIVWVFFLIVLPYFAWLYIQPYLSLANEQLEVAKTQSAQTKELIDKIQSSWSGVPGLESLKQLIGNKNVEP